MTHDELLKKKIDWIKDTKNAESQTLSTLGAAVLDSLNALRAVVELHKPYQHEAVSYVFCKGCTLDLDLAPPYPCETIQIIEKELI